MEWLDLPFDVDGPNGVYCTLGPDVMRIYLYGTDHPAEWRMHYPDRGHRVSNTGFWYNFETVRGGVSVHENAQFA